jgi:hypothetical protein
MDVLVVLSCVRPRAKGRAESIVSRHVGVEERARGGASRRRVEVKKTDCLTV